MSGMSQANPAEHALDFSRRWAVRLDAYCAIRMEALGIPDTLIGASDLSRGRPWHAFDVDSRVGGTITSGIIVDSGVFNPELLRGGKGESAWAGASLRDRIDAVIAHESEEARRGTHEDALREAPATELPITGGARQILRTMGS